MMYWVLPIVVITGLFGIYMWQIWCPRKPRKKRSKHRILCIGDSITFGAGVIPTRLRNSYPAILNRMLGKAYQVLNYGISGATAQENTDPPYESSFLRAAQDTDPEICILMLGTNDSKLHNWNPERYEAALEHWVHRIMQFPTKPRIILAAPPAVFSVNGKPAVYGIRDAVISGEVLPTVKRVSEKYNTAFLDLYSHTASHPEWFGDGVHPNVQGNHEIAARIYNELIKWRE